MILSLSLLPLGAQMQRARIHRVCAQPGDAVRPGSALLELQVELGSSAAQDCPPMFYYRLVCTEKAVVRTLGVSAGDQLKVGAPLGLFSSTADEPLDAAAARALRCTAISIRVDDFNG